MFSRTAFLEFALLVATIGLLASTAWADIVIDTVPVGHPGNAGEWSGESYGGYGPDRLCGAVDSVYNIGTYEVTAGQYTVFLNAVAGVDTYGLYNMGMWSSEYGCKIERYAGDGTADNPYQYRVANDATGGYWANRPVNYVSFWDSCRFTNWLHNGQPSGTQGPGTTETGAYTLNGYNGPDGREIQRNADWQWAVTSEDEWYKAAYHKNDGVTGNYFDYPTSSDDAPGYVDNSGKLSGTTNPFIEGGIDPGNYATYDGDGGTDGIGSPYYRTKVGEWENSGSPYGTFDQGGNVWEWNEAVINGAYGWVRGCRGGSFQNELFNMHALDRHDVTEPTHEHANVGFRVSRVPEPTSLVILALGAAGMLAGRRGPGR